MQTWMPPPKPMCSAAFARPTSSRSGSAKTRGSRLAEPKSIETTSPRGIGTPADLDAVLEHPALEQLERWIPADQLLDRSRCGDFARRRAAATAPGCCSSARTPLPSVFTVASCPAFSSTTTVETISSSAEPATVDSSLDERAHQVVARRAAPLLDQPEHVVAELGGRRALPTRPAPRSCRTRTSSRGGATSRAGRGGGRSARRAAGRSA